jgi:hypothetical protein
VTHGKRLVAEKFQHGRPPPRLPPFLELGCIHDYEQAVIGPHCNDLTSIATFEIDKSPDSLSNVRSAMSYSMSRSVGIRWAATRVRVRVCKHGTL